MSSVTSLDPARFQQFDRSLEFTLGAGVDRVELRNLLLSLEGHPPEEILSSGTMSPWVQRTCPDLSLPMEQQGFFAPRTMPDSGMAFGSAHSQGNQKRVKEDKEPLTKRTRRASDSGGPELIGPIKGAGCLSGRWEFAGLSISPGAKQPHCYQHTRCAKRGCPRRHLHRAYLRFIDDQGIAVDGKWVFIQRGDLQIPDAARMLMARIYHAIATIPSSVNCAPTHPFARTDDSANSVMAFNLRPLPSAAVLFATPAVEVGQDRGGPLVQAQQPQLLETSYQDTVSEFSAEALDRELETASSPGIMSRSISVDDFLALLCSPVG